MSRDAPPEISLFTPTKSRLGATYVEIPWNPRGYREVRGVKLGDLRVGLSPNGVRFLMLGIGALELQPTPLLGVTDAEMQSIEDRLGVEDNVIVKSYSCTSRLYTTTYDIYILYRVVRCMDGRLESRTYVLCPSTASHGRHVGSRLASSM